MKRHINESFLNELKNGAFKPIIDIVRVDPSLDLELRGNAVMVYYRGGKVLTIKEPQCVLNDSMDADKLLEEIDHKYLKGSGAFYPSLDGIDLYFNKAKRTVDIYEATVQHKLGEKEIQQRVVAENNYSVNSDQSDFFIADMEWEETGVFKGRADLVAFYWGHMSHKKKLLTMYLIEVKQGHSAIKTNNPNTDKETAGLLKHYRDYESFSKATTTMKDTKDDMLEVLRQKTELGLINGLDRLFDRDQNGKLSTLGIEIMPNVEFVFLLANYLHYSKQLKNELVRLPNKCKFFCSCFMGYGLYESFIVSKKTMANYPFIFRRE